MSKLYRVNSSEVFNLHSMYDHLKAKECELIECGSNEELDNILEQIEEVENLLDKASYVGSLVTWPELKRIREIRDVRNNIRYNIAIANGCTEKKAGYAIM